MALERAPTTRIIATEVAKTYRPPAEKVAEWYLVKDNKDSLGQIASKKGVSTLRLFDLNFPGSVEKKKIIPEVVNWYLHYHKEFNCGETADKQNRRFKGGEKIAIPNRWDEIIEEPIVITPRPGAGQPDDLESDGPIFPGMKIQRDFDIPKDQVTLGFFVAQLKLSVDVDVSDGSAVKAGGSLTKRQVKLGIEEEIEKDFKAGFNLKADEKLMKGIVAAFKSGDPKQIVAAFTSLFEASVSQTFKPFGPGVSIKPEIGLDTQFKLSDFRAGKWMPMPITIRCTVSGEREFKPGGHRIKLKGNFKGGFNVGLSRQGWIEIIKRVGPQVVKDALIRLGARGVAMWEGLVINGTVAAAGVVAGAIVGTIGLAFLTALLVEQSRRKGEIRSLMTWYSSAYIARIFNDYPPQVGAAPDGQLKQGLIDAGLSDAEADAIRLAEGNKSWDRTLEQAIWFYREAALIYGKGSPHNAKMIIKQIIEKQARAAAGG